jgi:hypothetical protein
MLLQLLAAAASAAGWYVETPEGTDRDTARVAEGHAADAGLAPRLVRRFVDGAGWRFFVRIEGFEDDATATAAATDLAARAHAPFAVFQIEGDRAVRLAVVGTGSAPPVPAATPAAPVLFEVLAAHGVSDGTLGRIRSGPVRVTYRRTLPGDRVVETTWLAGGGRIRVDVAPVRGDLRRSTTIVREDGAWLSVDGGPFERQDAEKTRTVIEQLAPEEVVPLVLALGSAVPQRREFERMAVVGEAPGDDGSSLLVLRFEGDATAGPVELAVSTSDHLVHAARFGDAGAVAHAYSDYRPVGELTVPFRVATERAGSDETDVVEVIAFDGAPQIEPTAFDVE